MGDEDDLVTINIREGELAPDQSWVYVWVQAENDRRVIYVGTTGIPTEIRAWLHLHHDTPISRASYSSWMHWLGRARFHSIRLF